MKRDARPVCKLLEAQTRMVAPGAGRGKGVPLINEYKVSALQGKV